MVSSCLMEYPPAAAKAGSRLNVNYPLSLICIRDRIFALFFTHTALAVWEFCMIASVNEWFNNPLNKAAIPSPTMSDKLTRYVLIT